MRDIERKHDLEANRLAMCALGRIFREVPQGCEEVRLSVRVLYDNKSYTLTGFLYFGEGRVWQRFEAQRAQVALCQEALKAAAQLNGWAMEERPSRRSSLEFLYTFRRARGAYEYRLESWAADTLEQRRKDKRFGEMFEKQLEASNER